MAATSIATAFANAAAPSAIGFFRAMGKRKYDELIAIYTNALDSFMNSSMDKVAEVKTLLNSESPIPINQIYVETYFDYGDNKYSDDVIIKKLKNETGAYAIVGFAGSGKSMFMKFAANTLIQDMIYHQRVTLFVEVKDLNFENPDRPLDEMIFEYCMSSDNPNTLDQFRIGLREGIFIVMLDGMDEAPAALLDSFLSKVQTFHGKYRQSVLIASVRPGTRLPNIQSFRVYKVSPMKLEQVVAVIDKSPFVDERKSILKQSLYDGLYETHHSFLSNPLLVTIVLITFDDASQVPNHLTGFYSAAFDALFGRHDWSKGVFVRQHKCGLEKPVFERVFTLFCYLSYFHSDYTFEKDKIIELIQKSLKHVNDSVSAYDFLHDCVLSVCLLQVDEPKVTFVHRSFQEYFTAKFVSQYSGPKIQAMLSWLVNRSVADNTFLMVTQLNREAVIRNWAYPVAVKLEKEWSAYITAGDWQKVCQEAGILKAGFTQTGGSVDIITISHQNGFSRLCALILAGDDDISTMDSVVIDTQLFKPEEFFQLPEATRRLISYKSQNGFLHVDLDERSTSQYPGIAFSKIADDILGYVKQSIQNMESFIREKDEFASLIDHTFPEELQNN